MYGNAVAFDGASDYVTVADSDAWDFSGKETTLALWFKADPTQPSEWAKLAEHRVGGQSTEGWFWGFDAAGESLVFHAISVGGTDHAWIEPSSTYDDGTWHHATVTLKDGMARLYVDGAFLLQDTYDPLSDEDDVLVIGGRSSLNGQIDELRIYDRALSAAEIATLAGVPDPEPDPIPNWSNISYTYDAAGRRITKDVDGKITKHIYDGDHVIAEYDGNNNLLRKFIYGPGTDNPVCMIEAAENDAKYYYHRDGLGNVVALSDDAGDTVQTYEYTVYGQAGASDRDHPNPYMFTGRRFDSETGLYYYRARIYNPYIGRFLQTDPIGYSDGINWYTYCGNNPGNFVDPSGLYNSSGYSCSRGCVWPADPCFVDVTGRKLVLSAATPKWVNAIGNIDQIITIVKQILGIKSKIGLIFDPRNAEGWIGEISPHAGVAGTLIGGAVGGPAGAIKDFYLEALQEMLRLLKKLQGDGWWRAFIEVQQWVEVRGEELEKIEAPDNDSGLRKVGDKYSKKSGKPFWYEIRYLNAWRPPHGYWTSADAYDAATFGIEFWPCFKTKKCDIPDDYFDSDLERAAASKVYIQR
jgi:RHS repeat-associated protein